VPAARPVAARLLPALLLVALAAGCTICPNPFDYAGPVPNGSVTQNDFRARSGGIIPIAAVPRPWPALVLQEAGPDERAVGLAAVPQGEPTQPVPSDGQAEPDADDPGVVTVVADWPAE
jgi:hypothetical protein